MKTYPKKSVVSVIILVFLTWCGVVYWQCRTHDEVKEGLRSQQLMRVRDISSTLGVVIRSGKKIGAVDPHRLNRSLAALCQSEDIISIVILTPQNSVAATSETALKLEPSDYELGSVSWAEDEVTAVDLIELGKRWGAKGTLVLTKPLKAKFHELGAKRRKARVTEQGTRPKREASSGKRRVKRGKGFDFRKIMDAEEFETLYNNTGLYKFVVKMDAGNVNQGIKRDLYLRYGITVVSLLTAIGLLLFWMSRRRAFDLGVDLVLAEEHNAHLRELNLAAAGLAHETRNPLNIVRGRAQLITREVALPESANSNATIIIDEVDRVNARLNEFINYSRPQKPTLTPVKLKALVNEVARSLEMDCEDKQIELKVLGEEVEVNADQPMLRQVIFNLLLNGVLYVPENGQLEAKIVQKGPAVTLEVADNGPGIAPELRADIFRPYFTCSDEGTGLGLAVVKQIVSAHGWRIECLQNGTQGALFRISDVKASSK